VFFLIGEIKWITKSKMGKQGDLKTIKIYLKVNRSLNSSKEHAFLCYDDDKDISTLIINAINQDYFIYSILIPIRKPKNGNSE
jgi:hypothetical protein